MLWPFKKKVNNEPEILSQNKNQTPEELGGTSIKNFLNKEDTQSKEQPQQEGPTRYEQFKTKASQVTSTVGDSISTGANFTKNIAVKTKDLAVVGATNLKYKTFQNEPSVNQMQKKVQNIGSLIITLRNKVQNLNSVQTSELNEVSSTYDYISKRGIAGDVTKNLSYTYVKNLNTMFSQIHTFKGQILEKFKTMSEQVQQLGQVLVIVLTQPQNADSFDRIYTSLVQNYQQVKQFMVVEKQYENRFIQTESKIETILISIKELYSEVEKISDEEIKEHYLTFLNSELPSNMAYEKVLSSQEYFDKFTDFHLVILTNILNKKTFKNKEMLKEMFEEFPKVKYFGINDVQKEVLIFFSKVTKMNFSSYSKIQTFLLKGDLSENLLKLIQKLSKQRGKSGGATIQIINQNFWNKFDQYATIVQKEPEKLTFEQKTLLFGFLTFVSNNFKSFNVVGLANVKEYCSEQFVENLFINPLMEKEKSSAIYFKKKVLEVYNLQNESSLVNIAFKDFFKSLNTYIDSRKQNNS